MCISNIGNRRPYPTAAAAAAAGKLNVDASLLSRVAAKDDFSQELDLSAFEPKPFPMNTPVAAPVKPQSAHIVVQHNYHDHSNDSRANYQEEHPARGGVTTPFPLKLHEMLDAVARDNMESIVSWQPHGRCFVVHKPKEFVELLPTYFKLSKLASFQRQLNLYGFQRLTRGRDRGGYYHELFLKGREFLAHNIQRIKVKGTGVRARSNPEQEPDFWAMSWVSDRNSQPSQQTVASSRNFPEASEIQRSSFSLPLNASTFNFDEPEVISAFGDKKFHYLDPFQATPMERQQQFQWTNQTVDDSLTPEAASFFRDFDFPEDIGTEIEDDNIFGDLLEQMIA